MISSELAIRWWRSSDSTEDDRYPSLGTELSIREGDPAGGHALGGSLSVGGDGHDGVAVRAG